MSTVKPIANPTVNSIIKLITGKSRYERFGDKFGVMFGRKFGETESDAINDAKKIDFFLKLCDIPNWERIAFPIE